MRAEGYWHLMVLLPTVAQYTALSASLADVGVGNEAINEIVKTLTTTANDLETARKENLAAPLDPSWFGGFSQGVAVLGNHASLAQETLRESILGLSVGIEVNRESVTEYRADAEKADEDAKIWADRFAQDSFIDTDTFDPADERPDVVTHYGDNDSEEDGK